MTGGEYPVDDKCELFDTNTNKWMQLPNLNEGRDYHSSCAFNKDTIYVFCGRDVNSIEKHTIGTNKWDTITTTGSTIGAIENPGLIQLNNDEIFIFGGYYGRRYVTIETVAPPWQPGTKTPPVPSTVLCLACSPEDVTRYE